MKYNDDNCEEKYCAVCEIRGKEMYHLRGIPSDLMMDSSYYLSKVVLN